MRIVTCLGTSPPSPASENHVHAGAKGNHVPLIGQDLGSGARQPGCSYMRPITVWPRAVPFSLLTSGKIDEGLSGAALG